MPEKMSKDDFKSQITRDVNEYEAYFKSVFDPTVSDLQLIYDGFRSQDPNLPAYCSNITFRRAFGLVHSEAGQAMPGIYQPNSFFTITANDNKSELGVKALQKYMYKKIPEMSFYKQHYWGIMDSLLMPAGWMKWVWQSNSKSRDIFKAVDGKVQTTTKHKKTSMMTCRSIDIKDVFYDWKGYGVDDMRYAGDKYYVLVEDIRNDDKKYNVSDDKADFLKVIDGMPTETRLTRVLVHECWYKDEVGIMTENGFLLCRQPNTAGGRLPYRPLVKFPRSRDVMGSSSVEVSADMLTAQDDLMNITLDAAKLDVLKPYTVEGNLTEADYELYPGKAIKVKPGTKINQIFTQPSGNDWINVAMTVDQNLNRVLGNIDQMEDKGIDTATQARFVQARANTGRRTYIDYNREDYLKWALEYWAEQILDNVSEKEMIEVIGEKDAAKLKLMKDKIGLANLSYTITITGDNDTEDRMTYIQNSQTFLGILGQIAQLRMIPNIPINWDLFTQSLVNKFQLPDGTYIENEMTLEKELLAFTASQIGKGSGQDPQAVMQGIQQAGSLTAYLQAQAQAEQAQGVPQGV